MFGRDYPHRQKAKSLPHTFSYHSVLSPFTIHVHLPQFILWMFLYDCKNLLLGKRRVITYELHGPHFIIRYRLALNIHTTIYAHPEDNVRCLNENNIEQQTANIDSIICSSLKNTLESINFKIKAL